MLFDVTQQTGSLGRRIVLLATYNHRKSRVHSTKLGRCNGNNIKMKKSDLLVKIQSGNSDLLLYNLYRQIYNSDLFIIFSSKKKKNSDLSIAFIYSKSKWSEIQNFLYEIIYQNPEGRQDIQTTCILLEIGQGQLLLLFLQCQLSSQLSLIYKYRIVYSFYDTVNLSLSLILLKPIFHNTEDVQLLKDLRSPLMINLLEKANM